MTALLRFWSSWLHRRQYPLIDARHQLDARLRQDGYSA